MSWAAGEAAARLAAGKYAEGFRPVTLHMYCDAEGRPLYRKIRMKHPETGEKWIRPMRMNGGGYELGEPQFEGGKPLYNLHRIAGASPGDIVLVVEGENCADALVKLGIVATTSGSSSSAKAADWSPLEGRRVLIWPDFDASGLGYAADVRDALDGIAATVEIIDPEKLGLSEKGDAVNWLEAHPGATAEDVLSLPRKAAPTPKRGPGDRVANVRRMADIKPEAIRWLWPGRIPLGKLTVISGDPGLGKSLITIALAAHVSTGSPWPVDRSACPCGDVVLLSAEDDPADTIRPRLDAAGADVSRVLVLESISEATRNGAPSERFVSLRRDLDVIEETIAGLPDCKLVVIDPVSAFLESADSYKDAEVRGFLAPIAKLAARCGVAIVVVMHLTKGRSANPLTNVNGSIGFVAASRAAFVVTKDKDDEGRRLVLPLKNNLGPDSSGVAYKVITAENETATVGWEPEPVAMTAREALAAEGDDERTEREQAANWLKEVLSRGREMVKQVKAEAREAGLSWRTVERAKAALGVKATHPIIPGPWFWELPKAANKAQGRHTSDVAALGDRGGLGGDESGEPASVRADPAAAAGQERGEL